MHILISNSKLFPEDISRVAGNRTRFSRCQFPKTLYYTLAIALAILTLLQTATVALAQNESPWWRFRGPNGSGETSGSELPPVDFSARNVVAWKSKLPGPGTSSPIVVGDRVFLTCYSGYGLDRVEPGHMPNLLRHIICVNRRDGSVQWQRDIEPHLPEDPFEGNGITQHGYASSTPVSDGERLYVFFGKSGVFAFDLEGQILWHKRVGSDSGEFRWGSAASPIIADGVLIINASDEAESLVGLDPNNGDELWRYTGVHNSWSTPIQMGEDSEAVIVLSVPHRLLAISPRAGEVLWESSQGAIDTNVSASLVAAGDKLLLMDGRSRTAMLFQRQSATGAEGPLFRLAWDGTTSGRISTPLIHEGYIYYFSEGKAFCQELTTGKYIFQERLPRPSSSAAMRRLSAVGFASPVLAGDAIYYVTKAGFCYVLRAAPEFEVLQINQLEEEAAEFNATPAISGKQIFVRSNRVLYCFE